MPSRARSSRSCNATRRCRTSSPSWAWTSCRKRTSLRSRARARSSAISRSPSTSPRSSPDRPGCSSSSPTPFAASKGCARENTTTCRRPPSTWSAPSSRPWRRARGSQLKRHDASERIANSSSEQRAQGAMATFHFDLVSPEKLLFSEEVEQVDLPGSEGDFGVLAGHAPIIATLRPGILVIYGAGHPSRIVVNGGFAEAGPAGLTVLREVAGPVDEFDASALAGVIKDTEEDADDETDDWKRDRLNHKLDQLRALQAALS